MQCRMIRKRKSRSSERGTDDAKGRTRRRIVSGPGWRFNKRQVFGSFCTILLSSLLISLLVVIHPAAALTQSQVGGRPKPSIQDMVKDFGDAKCVHYPPVLREIVNEELRKHKAKQEGRPYKVEERPEAEKCVNICDLCKERPMTPLTPIVPEPPRSLCLGDPPVVRHYLPFTTTKVTTSVQSTTPTPGFEFAEQLPTNIGSYAELQNKIMRADLPQDVIAKLLATFLYNQNKVTLHNALQNLSAVSPFESQEPPKPVGFSTRVAIMLYVNKYYECNENPADLRDLKY